MLKKEKIDTLQQVELAEGVEVSLRIAGVFVRSLAFLLDTIFLLLTMFVVSLVVGYLLSDTNSSYRQGVMLLIGFFFAWFYFYVFESGKKASTWGKRIMGLRVTDATGVPAARGQILARNLLRAADVLPGFVVGLMGVMVGGWAMGTLCILFTRKSQRIGDMAANTIVIYSRPVKQIVAPLPPALQVVTPSAVLSREEQLAIMDFKERAGIWSEARRMELSNHAYGLTGKTGQEGLNHIIGVSKWIAERE